MPEKATTHQSGFILHRSLHRYERTGRRSVLPLLLLLSEATTTKTTKLAEDKLIWIRLDNIAVVLGEAHNRSHARNKTVSRPLYI